MPRKPVPRLGELPELLPQSEPVRLDSYVRPGEVQFGRPQPTNPLLQLSEALSHLEPSLQRLVGYTTQQYQDEEIAKGERDFYENRELWGQFVKSGILPAGASPYYARGYQRASLKSLAVDFYNQAYQAFYSEEGTPARESNDPSEMERFLAKFHERFMMDRMYSKYGKPLYSSLDISEVFTPYTEVAKRSLMQEHAKYRVEQQQAAYEALASSQITQILDQRFSNVTGAEDEHEWATLLQGTAQAINDVLYNPDTGIVRNNMPPSKANVMMAEAVAAAAIREGNPKLLEVLDHVKTASGAPISKIAAVNKIITSASEHILTKQIQLDHYKEWLETQGHRAFERERQRVSAEREDVRWGVEIQRLQQTIKDMNVRQAVDHAALSLFKALRSPDAATIAKRVDQIFQTLEEIPGAWQEVQQLHHIMNTVLQSKETSVQDDPATLADLRYSIASNPLGFSPKRLMDAVKNKTIKTSTFMQLYDDYVRAAEHADHPLMKSPDYRVAMEQLLKSVVPDFEKGSAGEGALRSAEAALDFRTLVSDWIAALGDKEPNMVEYRHFLRETVTRLAETYNPDVRRSREVTSERQQQLGRAIVNTTMEAVTRTPQHGSLQTMQQSLTPDQKKQLGKVIKNVKAGKTDVSQLYDLLTSALETTMPDVSPATREALIELFVRTQLEGTGNANR